MQKYFAMFRIKINYLLFNFNDNKKGKKLKKQYNETLCVAS